MKDLKQTVEEAAWISQVLFEDSKGKGYKGDVDVSDVGRKGPANDTFSHEAVKSPKVAPPSNKKQKVKRGSTKRDPEDQVKEAKGDVSVAGVGRVGPKSASKVMVTSRPKSDGDKSKGKSYKQGSNPEDNIKEGMKVTITRITEKKNWIQGAEKSIKERGTEGKCTPVSKPGCTGKAKALALTFKRIANR